MWDHAFESLGCDTTECKVMLTDPPLNPKSNREQMMTTMFETYGFRGAYVQVQAVLTLYAQGIDDGSGGGFGRRSGRRASAGGGWIFVSASHEEVERGGKTRDDTND